VDRKLQLAFGKDCQEVNGAAIKLAFRSRHMVVAASRATLEADGRVRLSACYIAAFDQEPDGQKPAQITAIRASMARITFDQPIRNITNMVTREITSVDLPGNMRILGNK
jgi:hypothetical protein